MKPRRPPRVVAEVPTTNQHLLHVSSSIVDHYAEVPADTFSSMLGTTINRPPTGYLASHKKVEGQVVSTVEIDPVRGPFVASLFEQYATGSCSIRELRDATVNQWLAVSDGPGSYRPLSVGVLGRLLRNDYYIGVVTYQGVKYRGTHPPLIDTRLFGQVQRALAARSTTGGHRRQSHHLEDIVRCDNCGNRMVVGLTKNRSGGIDQFLVCMGRHDEPINCARGGVDVELVEAWVLDLHRSHSLGHERRRVLELLLHAGLSENAGGSVDDHVGTPLDQRDIVSAIAGALDLIEDIAERYEAATPAIRKELNATLFERIEIGPDGVTRAVRTPLYELLLDRRILGVAEAQMLEGSEMIAPAAHEIEVDNEEQVGGLAPDAEAVAEIEAHPVGTDAGQASPDWTPSLGQVTQSLRDWIGSHAVLLSVVNVLVWWLSIRRLDETKFDDLGIIKSLPLMAVISPLVAISLVAVSVSRRARDRVVMAHVASLIMMLYGVGVVVGNTLQARIVLRHEGIADTVLRTGSADPSIDAYFNWPGFFSFLAYARSVTGLDHFDELALWSPVLMNLLYVAPLLVIARAVSRHEATVWGTIVVFLLGNWVGQDYLAPQAISYSIYLTIIAALLVGADRAEPEQAHKSVAVIALVIALFAAIVPSHQLTPIMVALSVAGLVAFRRITARGLPLLMAAMLLVWLVFMSATYLEGNLRQMLDLIGDLGAARDSNVTQRLGGSEGHRQVVRWRLFHTGLIALIAAIGWMRSIVTKQHNLSITVLAAVPITMLFLQPYGGEMILRVYFFSLPFLAIYAIKALPIARVKAPHAVTVVALGICTVAMVLLFYVTRYGNARLDVFSEQEEAGIAALYDSAPPGSLILAAIDNLPWKDEGYEVFDHETIDRRVTASIDPLLISDATAAVMYADRTRAAYFIATSSQQTYIEILGGLPVDALEVTERLLRADPEIQVVVDQPTIRIYVLPAADGQES